MSSDALVCVGYPKSGYRIFTETSQFCASTFNVASKREIGASWEAHQLSEIHLWKDLAVKRGCT